MQKTTKINNREYMRITSKFYEWITEHKINEDNITKEEIDRFICYMNTTNNTDIDIIKIALRQYFSFIDLNIVNELGLMSTNFN